MKSVFAFWRGDRHLISLLALTLLLALAFNFSIIPGYGPDETRHFAYVRLLAEERSLPRVLSMVPYSEYKGAHAFHPPLYYLILLPFYAVFRFLSDESLTHLLRAISGLLCVACLPLLYDLGRVAGGNRKIGLLVAGLVGLTPLFGMTSGTLNNDAGAFWFCSLFLWLLVRWSENLTPKRAALLGAILGLGGLCKATALPVGAVAMLIWFWISAQKPVKNKNFALVLISGIVALLLVFPWHARSMALYGTWNPLPTAAPWSQLPPPQLGKLLTVAHPEFPAIFLKSNWGMFYSLWAQRDWLGQKVEPPLQLPPQLQPLQLAIYLVLALCAVLALLGFFKARKTVGERSSAQKIAFFAPLAGFGVVWLVVLQVALFLHQGWAEGGRYLFPIWGGFALFLAVGWARLLGEKLRIFGIAFLIFLLLLDGLSLYWLHAYLNPTFGPK